MRQADGKKNKNIYKKQFTLLKQKGWFRRRWDLNLLPQRWKLSIKLLSHITFGHNPLSKNFSKKYLNPFSDCLPNPFSDCLPCKWKFDDCPFVHKETTGSNPLANGINGANGGTHLRLHVHVHVHVQVHVHVHDHVHVYILCTCTVHVQAHAHEHVLYMFKLMLMFMHC